MNASQYAVSVKGVRHVYGETVALDQVSLELPAGATVGLIGPDGVGKSTLLSLIAGVKVIQQGEVCVLGGDVANPEQRQALLPRIAFMPQGLGKNLYPTLSVVENIDFHARLFGLDAQQRQARIQRLLDATGLAPFPDRAAGKLSGGMKQKLSLCCALVHDPELLILDEPTTGVDPLSRRQFWALVNDLRSDAKKMTVIVATAYIEEAEQFEHLLAMDDGKLLVNLPTKQVLEQTQSTSLEEAYVKLLPASKQGSGEGLALTPFVPDPEAAPAIQAEGLTKRFGDFVAVDHVNFTIARGEIFGFLGSNGCGKSTTMKMLTGLISTTEGSAQLLGAPVGKEGVDTRMRVGYMSQAFSLYEELTVRQNLELHAKLYALTGTEGEAAVQASLRQFDLEDVAEAKPSALPLGIRQRLQLAAACQHKPEVLILDEPTSGVDPSARDMFWRHLLELSRSQRITIFVSTHFMNEAARCDRISLMHHGRLLAVGTPEELQQQRQAPNLEEAFVAFLRDEEDDKAPDASAAVEPPVAAQQPRAVEDGQSKIHGLRYWLSTVKTFALREAKELVRDKVRLFFALMGPIILMASVVWSVSFDVKDQTFTVLDHDQTPESRQLVEYFQGSRYFIEKPPIHSSPEIDQALKSSYARLVIDIPSGFGRELLQRKRPEVAFYLDGAASFNATNLKAFVAGIVAMYTVDRLRETGLPISLANADVVEPRFRYNQDFKSINALAPGVLMLALILIPAMMTALAVVREREIGSIMNLYSSPASVAQYLMGKQVPYVVVGLLNYLLLVLMCIVWFNVPVRGSFWAMTLGAWLFVVVATGLGLLVSSLVRTQVAAIFIVAVMTLIPSINFSGFIYPIATLTGAAKVVGLGFPASWYQRISIGGFAKGLGFSDYLIEYAVLLVFAVVFLGIACLNLKKQEQ